MHQLLGPFNLVKFMNIGEWGDILGGKIVLLERKTLLLSEVFETDFLRFCIVPNLQLCSWRGLCLPTNFSRYSDLSLRRNSSIKHN